DQGHWQGHGRGNPGGHQGGRMSDMNPQDREELLSICGGKIPDEAVELYELYRIGHHRRNPGPLPYPVLLLIAVTCGGVKKVPRQASEWDDVPLESRVTVIEPLSKRVMCQGILLGR